MDTTEFLQTNCSQRFKNMEEQLALLPTVSNERQIVSSVDKASQQQGGLLEGAMKIWDCLPLDKKAELAVSITNLAKHAGNKNALKVYSKVGGSVVLTALAAVYLAYQCFQSIKRWWKGEITGKTCVKQCIDSLSEFIGGAGGAAVGAAAGAAIVPGIGATIGAIVGFLVGIKLGYKLGELITSRIFDLSKTEALENAYSFLGLNHRASNGEVSKNFRRLCLIHHPDKGGDADKFNLLQFHMATIKLDRVEFQLVIVK